MAKEPSILLSEKHGLNPSLMVCPFCGQETNGIALLGKLKGDAEAPRYIPDTELCDECKELMAQGFLLRERIGDRLTGACWVITHDAAERIFHDADLSHGCAYIDPDAAKAIGLHDADSASRAESE